MRNYLKYIFVFLILSVSSFIVSSFNSETDISSNLIINDIATETKAVVKEFKIIEHSKEQTHKVSRKLDSLMNRINKRHDFHGSILVAQNGKLIFSEQYGYANFKKKTTIDDASVFQLASVSKQFTATAIMMLQERDLLQLTDSVTKYFPEFPYQDVTIKHLLNHTAGLPNYFWIAEHKWEEEKAPTNKEMMQFLAETQTGRFFNAGRKFDYSNTGYFVLASIIEKVSNQSYGEFLKTNIFEPLQMNDSYVYRFENDMIQENQLSGYRLYRGWKHIPIKGTVNDGIVGDKNVYSTSEDLFKWMLALNNQKLISKESLDLMYTKGKTKYGRNVPYGFGFRIGKKNDANVIYHYGKWNGFSTAVTQYTDSDLLIIVLEHSSYNSMNYLNSKVKNMVEEYFESEPEEIPTNNSTKNQQIKNAP